VRHHQVVGDHRSQVHRHYVEIQCPRRPPLGAVPSVVVLDAQALGQQFGRAEFGFEEDDRVQIGILIGASDGLRLV
jgi:hypothetical protein